MNKNIVIGIVAVVLVAGGIYLFTQNQNTSPNGAPAAPSPAPVASPTPPSINLSAPALTPPTTPTANPSPAPATPPPPAPAPTPTPATHNVTIQNFAFSPSSITVKKGDTVVWTNEDAAEHTVTGNSGGPASPTIGTNGTYSLTFNGAGTFVYHCAIHPSMTGTVTVTQ